MGYEGNRPRSNGRGVGTRECVRWARGIEFAGPLKGLCVRCRLYKRSGIVLTEERTLSQKASLSLGMGERVVYPTCVGGSRQCEKKLVK